MKLMALSAFAFFVVVASTGNVNPAERESEEYLAAVRLNSTGCNGNCYMCLEGNPSDGGELLASSELGDFTVCKHFCSSWYCSNGKGQNRGSDCRDCK